MSTQIVFPFDPNGGAAGTFPLLYLELRSDGSFNARLNQSSDAQKWKITTDEDGISCVQGNLDVLYETKTSDSHRNNCKLSLQESSPGLRDSRTETRSEDDVDDAKAMGVTEHCYVYYRAYTYDGAMPSNSPAYSDDLYLGRICIEQIALPRTVKSLKRCLSAVEGIGDYNRTKLYLSATSETLMDDNSHITANAGAGSTPDDPMTLLFKGFDAKCARSNTAKPAIALLPPSERKTPVKQRYFYYRIYTEDGAMLSKWPIDSQDSSLGRINVDAIALPHTTSSIKRCIARAEQLCGRIGSQLFANMSSESPMDEERTPILTNDFLGSTAKEPVVYVHIPPVRVRANQALDWSVYPGWLKIAAGEIFDSDGVVQPQSAGGGIHNAYTVINSEGDDGFVYAAYCQIL